MILRIKIFVAALLCLCIAATTLHAQTTENKSKPDTQISHSDALAKWRGILQSTEQALSRDGLDEDELARMSQETSAIRQDAFAFDLELTPLANKIREQLDQLGPLPAEGEPLEADEIAGKRKELDEEFSKIDGHIKAGRLVALRAVQIEQQIIENRRSKFVTQISRHSKSILNPSLWTSFTSGMEGFTSRFSLLMQDSYSAMKARIFKSNLTTALLGGGIVLVIVISWLFRQFFKFRYRRANLRTHEGEEHYLKIRLAAISLVRRGIIPSLALFALYLVFNSLGIFTSRISDLLFELVLVSAGILTTLALVRIFLYPRRPELRIAWLSTQAALKIKRIITISVFLIGLFRLLNKTAVILVSPFEVSIAFSALLALVCFVGVFAVLTTILSARRKNPMQMSIRRNLVRWGFINPLFWLVSISGIISLIAGYIAFAEFLTWQILFGAIIFAVLWLCIELLDLYRERYLHDETGQWHQLSEATGFSKQSVLQISVFGFGLVKLIAIISAATIFMASWGYRSGDWAGPISEAFFGFSIGGLNISISSIAVALLLFIGAYILTRAIQNWLRTQFLPTTKLDPGLRNSIATVFGYAGIVLAAILAITAAGLDLSKVAIVAGALSVGIGFGLQSIVNNFVSGLILLAERPIRSGDWIVTSGGEGTVRKTSVRSTEIETFDGATVIIPNSTLITESVTNWTHHNQKGRIKIKIGVGYDSDPEQVRKLLLACANSHERVIDDPSPIVFFQDFGSDALEFELRAYLADINNSVSTKSDLRFAILKALRKANIEIPYPQRDIHIKSGDGLALTKKPTLKKPNTRG